MFQRMFDNFHLEKLLWIIRTKLKYIILVALTGGLVAGGIGILMDATIYRAELSMYVYSNPDYVTDSDVNISVNDLTQANGLLSSYMQIMRSNSFLRDVLKSSGLSGQMSIRRLEKRISAEGVDKTSVFKVYVYDENPEYAQRIANTIGELAPDRIISIVKSGGIEILEKAELPVEPYESTSVRMFALLGAVGGAMLAALWAVIRGLNDTTIRRPYEVTDRFCPEILAQIPQMKNSDEAVLCKNCEFELREAYRDLRSALLCRHEEEMCQLYAVTSADPGEGKTLIAKNLAASAAEAGRKVLLLQADVRKAEEGNAGKETGAAGSLAEYLRGDAEKIHPQQCESGAFLLPQGDLTKDGAELLFGSGFTGLLKKCRKEYDLILVDLPPLAVFSDALCMADEADGYLIVVREKVTRTERTELVLRRLESAGAAVRGFVYNGISRTSPDYNFAEKTKNYGYHENCVKNKKTDLKVQTNA